MDLDQLNARPNPTTAAYTKFLLRIAEGPQVRWRLLNSPGNIQTAVTLPSMHGSPGGGLLYAALAPPGPSLMSCLFGLNHSCVLDIHTCNGGSPTSVKRLPSS